MCGRGVSFISFFLKFNPFIDSMQFHKEICLQFCIKFFHRQLVLIVDSKNTKNFDLHIFCNNGSHYINWYFNGKNTSHLHLQRMSCKGAHMHMCNVWSHVCIRAALSWACDRNFVTFWKQSDPKLLFCLNW